MFKLMDKKIITILRIKNYDPSSENIDTGLPEHKLLITDTISTKISCTDPYIY